MNGYWKCSTYIEIGWNSIQLLKNLIKKFVGKWIETENITKWYSSDPERQCLLFGFLFDIPRYETLDMCVNPGITTKIGKVKRHHGDREVQL